MGFTGASPSGKASDFDSDKGGDSCPLAGSNPAAPANGPLAQSVRAAGS